MVTNYFTRPFLKLLLQLEFLLGSMFKWYLLKLICMVKKTVLWPYNYININKMSLKKRLWNKLGLSSAKPRLSCAVLARLDKGVLPISGYQLQLSFAHQTLLSAPYQLGQKFSGAHVCTVPFKHLPQPLKSHNRSFGTLEQLLKIPPFVHPNIAQCGRKGGRICF